MIESKVIEGTVLTPAQVFEIMEENAGFYITPCEGTVDLDNRSLFTKLHNNSEQRMQISTLLTRTPQAIAAGKLEKVYTVCFLEGLPHTLVILKQSSFSIGIHAEKNFVNWASSLHSDALRAAILEAFTVMSDLTGQYFLTRISSELNVVDKKTDDILELLYGDKKAELIAVISFVKYAHSNFSTIMMHEEQRIATITSLQSAKKTAIKNTELYLNDLTLTSEKISNNYQELRDQFDTAMKIKDSIEMSCQLWVISGLLELYYSRNYDKEYSSFIENDMNEYLSKCDKHILSIFDGFKEKFDVYFYKLVLRERETSSDALAILQTIRLMCESYKKACDSPLRIAMHEALDSIHRTAEYYVTALGDIYARNNA